jgi:hypothetical protein
MTMSGYTKLFSNIVASTIWREDDKTRILWITLLALSDKDGFVGGSIPGLADMARMSIADCEQGLQKLQQPDPYSRTLDHEGRRIEVVDGGWLILNRAKYRDLIPDEQRRERDRIRQQRHRAAVSRATGCDGHDLSHQTKEETETEIKAEAKPSARSARSGASRPHRSENGEPELTDPRHVPTRKLVQELHLQKFKIKPQWDGSEGKVLDRLLQANPSWSQIDIDLMVRNHSASEGIPSARPRSWLPRLGDYAGGPLDRYGKVRKCELADCFEQKDYKAGLTENADGSYR